MRVVSVILLNYHTKQKVIERITKITSAQDKSDLVLHPIVVDNSPNSDLRDWCADNDVKYIPSDDNSGYAGGNNIGIERALDDGDYVFILNPDAELLSDDVVRRSVSLLEENDSVGIMSPTAVDQDGDEFDLPTTTSKLLRVSRVLPQLPSADEALEYVDHVPGCSMCICREVFEDVGLLTQSYFLYLENIDYCFRARTHGYYVAIAKDTYVQHDRPSSSLKSNKNIQSYYKIRNSLLLPAFVFSGKDRVLAQFIFLFNVFYRILLIGYYGNWRSMKAALYGVFDAIRKRDGRRDQLFD